MEGKNEKAVSALCELAQFVKDGNVGYKKAADETTDSTLKSFCLTESTKRAAFLGEINSAVMRLGGNPEHSDTIKGALYHKWMDVKAALTGRDEEAIVGSCIFGEDWAIKAYHEALECQELPADVRMTLEKQHQVCHTAHAELKRMKETYHHH